VSSLRKLLRNTQTRSWIEYAVTFILAILDISSYILVSQKASLRQRGFEEVRTCEQEGFRAVQ
jgi:hypothetical protein